ncbi:hypothetical protein ACP70R_008796 [Stipagrostis hirtigluma subsp. patula]
MKMLNKGHPGRCNDNDMQILTTEAMLVSRHRGN